MTSSHPGFSVAGRRHMDRLPCGLCHAVRLLWKSKRITATMLLTLALCIGATTAIFSSVYSLMLKPLPYREPERIVELYSSAVKVGLNRMPANMPFYLDYSENATSYESLALAVLLQPGRRERFGRPHSRRADDRRDLQHPSATTRANSIRQRLLQAMKEIPGVTSAALSFSTPFQGELPINAFTLENDTLPPGSPQPGAFRVIVTQGTRTRSG